MIRGFSADNPRMKRMVQKNEADGAKKRNI